MVMNFSADSTVSISVALSIARNEIHNNLDAYINNVDRCMQ